MPEYRPLPFDVEGPDLVRGLQAGVDLARLLGQERDASRGFGSLLRERRLLRESREIRKEQREEEARRRKFEAEEAEKERQFRREEAQAKHRAEVEATTQRFRRVKDALINGGMVPEEAHSWVLRLMQAQLEGDIATQNALLEDLNRKKEENAKLRQEIEHLGEEEKRRKMEFFMQQKRQGMELEALPVQLALDVQKRMADLHETIDRGKREWEKLINEVYAINVTADATADRVDRRVRAAQVRTLNSVFQSMTRSYQAKVADLQKKWELINKELDRVQERELALKSQLSRARSKKEAEDTRAELDKVVARRTELEAMLKEVGEEQSRLQAEYNQERQDFAERATFALENALKDEATDTQEQGEEEDNNALSRALGNLQGR